MALRLTVGFSDNLRVRPLLDGSVNPQNVVLDFVTSPVAELFYRNLKFEEFDVMEMAIACTIMAKERSDGIRWDWSALPVFLSKAFLWKNLYVNTASGINNLNDLKGKRVGVPDYPMDAVLWMLVMLKELYGIKASDMAWFCARAKQVSHGAQLGLDRNPPAGVKLNWIDERQTLDAMLDRQEIDAGLLLPSSFDGGVNMASIDRYGGTPLSGNPRIRKMFEDGGRQIVTEYYRKTGIISPNHIIVIKSKLARAHPWLMLELYKAFQRAKEVAYQRSRELMPTYLLFEGRDFREQAAIFGEDPYPLGLKANSKMMETAIQGCLEQGLISKKFPVEEVFHHSMLDT